MADTKTTKREKLLQKLEKTKAEIKRIDAQERQKKRKIENRTKIIIGGTVMAHMSHDPEFKKEITSLIKRYGRKQDKEYLSRHKLITGFNMAATKKETKSSAPAKHNKGYKHGL